MLTADSCGSGNPVVHISQGEGASSLGFLGITSAGETFAQFAPHTAARCLISDNELRFALAAETFLPSFHGPIAGSDGHGAKLDATIAFLTELGPDAEGMTHMAVLTPSHKADRFSLPDLGANPYAASA